MKKTLIVALLAATGVVQAATMQDAQRMIDANFDPQDCGKVMKIINRPGGGQTAVCSNRASYMLTGVSKFPVMRCDALDSARAMGYTNFPTTRECRGY